MTQSKTTQISAIIQARMSSSRFPGKVLRSLWGEPLIQHVLRAVQSTPGIDAVVVATSDDVSDDPLAAYLQSVGALVFRGPLTDVLLRYQLAAQAYPAEWVLRICADSPCVDSEVLKALVCHAERDNVDLITTRYPARFPKGQNAELIRTQRLLELNSAELTTEEREHVTPYFYHHPDRYGIIAIAPGATDLAQRSLVVDTPEELAHLEQLSRRDLPSYDARKMLWTFHPRRVEALQTETSRG